MVIAFNTTLPYFLLYKKTVVEKKPSLQFLYSKLITLLVATCQI